MNQEIAATFVPILELKEWDKNPRINDHAVEKVAASIKRFGFGAPVVARLEDKTLIAGHTRLKAARFLGLETIPCRYLDISTKEAELLALADNKLGEIAVWEDNMLASLLSELDNDDAIDLGWTEYELKNLLNEKALEVEDWKEFTEEDLTPKDKIICPHCEKEFSL